MPVEASPCARDGESSACSWPIWGNRKLANRLTESTTAETTSPETADGQRHSSSRGTVEPAECSRSTAKPNASRIGAITTGSVMAWSLQDSGWGGHCTAPLLSRDVPARPQRSRRENASPSVRCAANEDCQPRSSTVASNPGGVSDAPWIRHAPKHPRHVSFSASPTSPSSPPQRRSAFPAERSTTGSVMAMLMSECAPGTVDSKNGTRATRGVRVGAWVAY